MVNIFISYSLNDKEGAQQIKNGLAILRRQNKLLFFDQHEDPIGERAKSIQKALESVQIILLVVSNNFIASDECYDIQQKAIKLTQTQGVKVIPVLYNNCAWNEMELGKLQALPRNKIFISNWPNPDVAYAEISKEIGALVKSLAYSPLDSSDNIKTDKRIDFSELRMSIAKGYLEETLDKLIDYTAGTTYYDETIILKSRYSTLQKNIRSNILDPDLAERQQNQIRQSTLILMQILEKRFSN